MNGTTNITISDLRKNLAEAIDNLNKTQKSLVISQRSKPKAILADYEYFMALEESLVDLADTRDIKKRANEPSISFEKFLKKNFGTENISNLK